ncbi:hypothetical protein V8G54_023951 [Vigna mungo]|uniref:Uncharacterized protein n=1 Tax=Vigna mungo TaxID=3915 RepID=A0AAQ3N689_VIGMU
MHKKKTITVCHFPLSAEAEEETETLNPGHEERNTEEESNRRPSRQSIQPSRLDDYELYSDVGINEEGDIIHLALIVGSEPLNVNEALSQSKWKEAMIQELKSIEKNQTWKLVDLSKGK